MIIDLSHPIENSMPVYPGTEAPLIERAFTLKSHGFAEARLRMVSHTGTHIDAPAHMISGGKRLDDYPVDYYMGQALCLQLISGQHTLPLEKRELISRLQPQFILFRTGWSRYWGREEYFGAFPLPDSDSIDWLCRSGIRGIGLDAISVDPVGASHFPNHLALLGAGMIILENLNRLEALPQDLFMLACFPLSLKDADGSPTRAVAVVKET